MISSVAAGWLESHSEIAAKVSDGCSFVLLHQRPFFACATNVRSIPPQTKFSHLQATSLVDPLAVALHHPALRGLMAVFLYSAVRWSSPTL